MLKQAHRLRWSPPARRREVRDAAYAPREWAAPRVELTGVGGGRPPDIGRWCRLWLRAGLVGWLGVASWAAPCSAREATYVITFSSVTVREPDGVPSLPEVAHLDPPPAPPASEAGDSAHTRKAKTGQRFGMSEDREGRALDMAYEQDLLERNGRWYLFDGVRLGMRRPEIKKFLRDNPDVLFEMERKAGLAPAAAPAAPGSKVPPHSTRAFAPGQPVSVNPSFVEQGFRVESFWAVGVGTPEAYFKRAHFHPPDLVTGFEAQHLGNPSELSGIFIRALDGRPFGIRSLRYRVTRNRQIPSKPLSLDGYNNFAVQVLLAESFDPRRTVRSQFTGFPAGLPLGNDPTLPWSTLYISGFELATEVYIASSASIDIDNIVLVRAEPDTPGQTAADSPEAPAANPEAPGASPDTPPADDETSPEAPETSPPSPSQ